MVEASSFWADQRNVYTLAAASTLMSKDASTRRDEGRLLINEDNASSGKLRVGVDRSSITELKQARR